MELPAGHLAVLVAMTWPDPQPPAGQDSPALAVCRRLPGLTEAHASGILGALNALGLTNVPFVERMVSTAATADLAKWITEDGWKALGRSAGGKRKQ